MSEIFSPNQLPNDNCPPRRCVLSPQQKSSAIHVELSVSTNPIPPATGKTLSILMTNKSSLPNGDVIDTSNPNQPGLIVPHGPQNSVTRIYYITLSNSWDWEINQGNATGIPLTFKQNGHASFYEICLDPMVNNGFYIMCCSTGSAATISHDFNLFVNMQASQSSKLPIVIDPAFKNPLANPH